MDTEERISRRAYNIWCAEGWPVGRHQEHWAQACREIEEADATPDAIAAREAMLQGRRCATAGQATH